MKWAVVATVLVVVAFLVGGLSGWETGRRSGGEERVVLVTATVGPTRVPATAVVRTVTLVVTATPGPTEIPPTAVVRTVTVVVTATPAPIEAPATAVVPTVIVEGPTAAPVTERCYGDETCLDRQCPGVLGAPEGARTSDIEDCVRWWGDLPSADPRRNIDRERVKAEICRRGPAEEYVLLGLGYTPWEGSLCQ